MIAFPIVNAWRGFANDTWNHSQGWIAAIVVLSILAASLYPRKVEYATFYTVGAVPALSIGWRKKDARDRFDAFLNRISERIRAKAVAP
jgi:hypothetical protein